jgi:predicted GH43/DUF377 family glycosyl hydrolase
MGFFFDSIVFDPRQVDMTRSPLAGRLGVETFALGAFNPGMTRLPGGNLLLMVRIAEALREPVHDGHIHSIRWDDGDYHVDAWPLDKVDHSDPRTFRIADQAGGALALTSLSWLLPIELDPEGSRVVAVRYDKAIAPRASYQCYGIEDPRVSRIGDKWLMTTCSVSPERLCTTLYTSNNALDWRLEGIVLDHQNKDMLIFEGLIGEHYWALTRPLGDTYLAYPPGSEWRAGPAINLASSPDALHWKPCERPGLRPHSATVATARMGGGAPPMLTPDGWLALWHGVEPGGSVGIYRTYWSLLDRDDPSVVVRTNHDPLIEPAPDLTRPIEDLMYLDNITFTTGLVDAGDHVIVASGEADLACRITHVPKRAFALE